MTKFKIINKFIWNGKKRLVLCKNKVEGGLKMTDMNEHI